MKKTCIAALALLAITSFKPGPEFRITGQVTGGKEGMTIYLKYADIREKKAQDSTVLHDGKFEFKGTVASPRFYTIVFNEGATNPSRPMDNRITNLFVENSDITLQIPYDSLMKEWQAYSGSGISPAVTVKGSASHAFYLRYDQEKRPLDKKKSALFDDYITFLNPAKGTARQPRKNGMALCREMDKVDSSRKAFVMRFVKNNAPNEVLGFIALRGLDMSNINTGDVDQLVKHFSDVKQKGAILTKFMEESQRAKKTVVGSDFVNFTMKDTSGNTHSLNEYIGKGKYVLLECWASWCGPCRADIPHLKEVYSLYNPKGFEIVSVSLDDNREKWTKAINDEKMVWSQLSDLQAFTGDLPRTYGINGIPACLLFDPQGKLVTRNMRGSWMDIRLIRMYGNQFPGE